MLQWLLDFTASAQAMDSLFAVAISSNKLSLAHTQDLSQPKSIDMNKSINSHKERFGESLLVLEMALGVQGRQGNQQPSKERAKGYKYPKLPN